VQIFNKLFCGAEYTINKRKSIFGLLPKYLVWTQQHIGPNVTITIKVLVYAQAERAEKLPFSPLPFSPLCCTLEKSKVTRKLELAAFGLA
jgi:hypothetical protein